LRFERSFGLEWREVDPENQSQPGEPVSPEERVERNPEVEEFFHRLMEKHDLRRPKPGAEAIAAALQAIQRLGSRIEAQQADAEPGALKADGESSACAMCGFQNQNGNQFCSSCGGPLSGASGEVTPGSLPGAQHHYHHHYHHHYVAGQDSDTLAGLGQRPPGASGVAGPLGKELPKLRSTPSGQGLTRAEATIRQLTNDWAAACNNKQLEDLLEFYGADAMVMRPNIPPVRGTAAIREFFVGALEAGLGDVEMEVLRLDILGEVAYQAGRCKMLVPVVMGKRREERGKYVIVFAKEKSGQWKAVVDCWASDLGLNVPEPLAGSVAPILPPKPRR
jgi:ketosteroid isomerase-like protein